MKAPGSRQDNGGAFSILCGLVRVARSNPHGVDHHTVFVTLDSPRGLSGSFPCSTVSQ